MITFQQNLEAEHKKEIESLENKHKDKINELRERHNVTLKKALKDQKDELESQTMNISSAAKSTEGQL